MLTEWLGETSIVGMVLGWQFDCKAGAAHFGFDVGPFLGHHHN